jgi:ubiquinone/menaquinone biosynthesis C-methylase UbiE
MNFNVQSISWDNEKRINRAKVIAAEIASATELEKSYSALEFGCGTGLVSFNLYDKLKNIVCIDTSKGMIDILNTKIKQH